MNEVRPKRQNAHVRVSAYRLWSGLLPIVLLSAVAICALQINGGAELVSHATLATVLVFSLAIEACLRVLVPHYKRAPLGWSLFDILMAGGITVSLLFSRSEALALIAVCAALRTVSAVIGLRVIIGALFENVASLGAVVLLLSLHFFVYACIGNFFFGANDPAHFGTLGLSLVSLFRVLTLEDWTDLMYIQMYGSDVYGDQLTTLHSSIPEASPVLAVLFFVSFVLLGTTIILNLFIGALVGGITAARQAQEHSNLRSSKAGGKTLSPHDEVRLLSHQLNELKDGLENFEGRMRAKEKQNPNRFIYNRMMQKKRKQQRRLKLVTNGQAG